MKKVTSIFFFLLAISATIYMVSFDTKEILTPSLPVENKEIPCADNSQQLWSYHPNDLRYGKINWKIKIDKIWTFKTDDEIGGLPIISDEKIYYRSANDNLHAIDVKTGSERWKINREYMSQNMDARPVIHGGTLFFGDTENMYAIETNSGKEKWKFKLSGSYPAATSPLVNGNLVYFGSENQNFYAVDIETGVKKWSFATKGYIRVAPVACGKLVFLGSNDGFLYAVDKMTGQEKWKFKAQSIIEGLGIVDEVIYLRDGDHNLYAINSQSGQNLWERKSVYTQLVNIEIRDSWSPKFGFKYRYYIFAIDIKSGEEKWRHETAEPISYLIVSNGVAYFRTDSGNLYAMDTKTQKLWKYELAGKVATNPITAYGSIFVVTSVDGEYFLNAISIDNIKKSVSENIFIVDSVEETGGPIITKSDGLVVEEYKYLENIEDFSYLPEIILSKRSEWRNQPPHYESKNLVAIEKKNDSEERSTYASIQVSRYSYKIMLNDKPVYEVKITDYPFDSAIKKVDTYGDHWFLEYMDGESRYAGTVIADGVNINKEYGYKEVFNYTIINEKPFYIFMNQNGNYKISFGDNILPLSYEKVIHYACCSESGYNPSSYKSMVTFWGLRDGYWYYVEAGVYE